jgi:hypothetical protein
VELAVCLCLCTMQIRDVSDVVVVRLAVLSKPKFLVVYYPTTSAPLSSLPILPLQSFSAVLTYLCVVYSEN